MIEETTRTVAALLRERESYEQRGMKERAEQVDEQLRLLGAGTKFTDQRKKETRPAKQAMETR